jgi:bifunctional non-homologous end joining protein LigD
MLDGEVVVQRPDGTTGFQALQNAIKSNRRERLLYYVFDAPFLDGEDIRKKPLIQRKERLRRALPADDDALIRYSDHVDGKGERIYNESCRHRLEGIISKKKNSTYQSARTKSWVKVKCIQRQEFVIGGYTKPSGSRKHFGALLVGTHNENGDCIYNGKVGTGFTDASLREIHKAMQPLTRKTPPFKNPPKGVDARGVTWLTPSLLCEVEFTEWTEDDILRHPSFQGLRQDKQPSEVVREEPALPPSSVEKQEQGPVIIASIQITSPEKVLYPDQGVTKRQLCEYYDAVAERMLPFVSGRPLSVVRCPQGRQKKCFYQKHLNERMPDAVHGVTVTEKEGEEAVYLMIDSGAGLVALAQHGVLEVHPWGARGDRLDRPDTAVFDLDPDVGLDWARVVDAAELLRDVLTVFGLRSFVKLSGGKGMHVVAPISRTIEWDDLKEFTKNVARKIEHESPRHFTSVMSKQKRRGRIFIDYLRNGRGATSVAPYSTRARQGATVSVPIAWEELSASLKPDAFRIDNVLERLGALKKDPWEDYFTVRQSITKPMREKAME